MTQYSCRYKQRTGSIFLDGLVGGMFLSFLLDTSEKCDDKDFIAVFFFIGLTHYATLVLQDQMDYSSRVAAHDDVKTKMERFIEAAFPVVLHIIRLLHNGMNNVH